MLRSALRAQPYASHKSLTATYTSCVVVSNVALRCGMLKYTMVQLAAVHDGPRWRTGLLRTMDHHVLFRTPWISRWCTVPRICSMLCSSSLQGARAGVLLPLPAPPPSVGTTSGLNRRTGRIVIIAIIIVAIIAITLIAIILIAIVPREGLKDSSYVDGSSFVLCSSGKVSIHISSCPGGRAD